MTKKWTRSADHTIDWLTGCLRAFVSIDDVVDERARHAHGCDDRVPDNECGALVGPWGGCLEVVAEADEPAGYDELLEDR